MGQVLKFCYILKKLVKRWKQWVGIKAISFCRKRLIVGSPGENADTSFLCVLITTQEEDEKARWQNLLMEKELFTGIWVMEESERV